MDVATLGPEWVGFIQYGATDRASVMEIRRVYVDKNWQGLGIGSALLHHALNSDRIRAARSTEINVWETNLAAGRLYERFGFTATDRRVPFLTHAGQVVGYDVVLARPRSTP